jgi:putative aldouronate transport system permease protein
VATVTLLVGLSYWNDWINGLYYINKDTMYSIQSLLNKMLMDVQFLLSNAQSGASINQDIVLPSTGIKMAIAVMGAVPILMVYPFFQKYFIKGIIIGAVKG